MKEQVLAVQRMQDYIEAHLDEKIGLSELSSVSLFSPVYSYRLFQEYTGLTPSGYIRRLRLAKAALRIKNEHIRMIDVAFDLGFGNQVERLICDQFRRCKVCKGYVAAADRNGLRRLVDAVELRLDPSEPDALKVKAVVAAFPDHSAPKALVCREQEESRFVPVRQTPAAFLPMCPSSSVGV